MTTLSATVTPDDACAQARSALAELERRYLHDDVAPRLRTLAGRWLDALTYRPEEGRGIIALPLPPDAWATAAAKEGFVRDKHPLWLDFWQGPLRALYGDGITRPLGVETFAALLDDETPLRYRAWGCVFLERERLNKVFQDEHYVPWLARLGGFSGAHLLPREQPHFRLWANTPLVHRLLRPVPFHWRSSRETRETWVVLFHDEGSAKAPSFVWAKPTQEEAFEVAYALARQSPREGQLYRLPKGYQRFCDLPVERLLY